MAYSTNFVGQFEITPQLNLDNFQHLKKFAETEHRDEDDMPGDYCQWTPTEDGRGLEWDGHEEFYDYMEWLQWLIDHKFTPNGYVLTGSVAYQGEEVSDSGVLVVKDGKVIKSEYKPADADIEELVRKGLEDETSSYYYLQEIAKKLGIGK